MVQLSIVAAGVIVVLAAIWLARGRAEPRPSDRAPADPFAQPVVHHVGADRRRLTRAPIARPVVVRRDLGEQRTFALDVSSGGVLLAGPADLTVGEVLDVRVDLGEPVGGRGRVVRET
ncbi:MAG TPA: PilZ domain-containing protein, partial [Solirubrobacter sp.]|nr:PilZ domain-containing protein [Solirubrobacter sp.]